MSSPHIVRLLTPPSCTVERRRCIAPNSRRGTKRGAIVASQRKKHRRYYDASFACEPGSLAEILLGCQHGLTVKARFSSSSRQSYTDCCTVNHEVTRTARIKSTLIATKIPPRAERLSSPAASIVINSARKLLRKITTQPCGCMKKTRQRGAHTCECR